MVTSFNHTKVLFAPKSFFLLLAALIMLAMPVFAHDVNFYVSCAKKNPRPPHDVKRKIGDTEIWQFKIHEVGGAHLSNFQWSVPTDKTAQEWGVWTGKKTKTLTWTPPGNGLQVTGKFNVSATGDISCSGTGGGEGTAVKPTFSVSLAGEVVSGEPDVTFSKKPRACAGHILDSVHEVEIDITTKEKGTDTLMAATLNLSFDGNDGSTLAKYAKFLVGGAEVDTTTVTTKTTGATPGKTSVTVISSDVVSSDIKIKVEWTDESGKEHDVGEKACDFAASVSLRRFGLVFYPKDEDTGWIFGDATVPAYSNEIIASSGTTPAKVYLKFQVDPSIAQDKNYFKPDGTPVALDKMTDYGNWKAVSGHYLLIKIDSITAQPGSTFDGTISHYATLLDASGQPTDEMEVVTSGDGTAQVSIRAGTKISHAKEVVLSVQDISEHKSEES